MSKITLENQYGEYSVSTKKEDLHIAEMFDDLVIPVLLAAGYHQGSIDEYLNPDLGGADEHDQ